MTIVYLGLGSNQGDKIENLSRAVARLSEISTKKIRISPRYETPALLPPNAPLDWDQPYNNLVVEIEYSGSPIELLRHTQKIEEDMGRVRGDKWAPRTIDIDILSFGSVVMETPELTLPHAEMLNRAFVLDPLKDLAPSLVILGQTETVFTLARAHPQHQPSLMAIVNVTPDSFSDGGQFTDTAALENHLAEIMSYVAMIDLGAESTRPNAPPLSPGEEWQRLQPALMTVKNVLRGNTLAPRISVDTRHGEVAAKALELGVDIINDVGGFTCPVMRDVIASSNCDYALMHALSVPVDPKLVLPANLPPTESLIRWFNEKRGVMESYNINPTRVMIDPGIGFGKTPQQNLEILRNIKLLQSLGWRILVGHSRKSFLNHLFRLDAPDRDAASIGVSLALAQSGVDILRVHNPLAHYRALLAYVHAQGVR
jgi:2-amino-4-hydroxy-6-hydroxymethyldihydropteridine diphosphokinase/dihydropteroate synthase